LRRDDSEKKPFCQVETIDLEQKFLLNDMIAKK
jgi:hypothetical protein